MNIEGTVSERLWSWYHLLNHSFSVPMSGEGSVLDLAPITTQWTAFQPLPIPTTANHLPLVLSLNISARSTVPRQITTLWNYFKVRARSMWWQRVITKTLRLGRNQRKDCCNCLQISKESSISDIETNLHSRVVREPWHMCASGNSTIQPSLVISNETKVFHGFQVWIYLFCLSLRVILIFSCVFFSLSAG